MAVKPLSCGIKTDSRCGGGAWIEVEVTVEAAVEFTVEITAAAGAAGDIEKKFTAENAEKTLCALCGEKILTISNRIG